MKKKIRDQRRFIKRLLIDITTRCNLKCIMCGVPHLEERFDMPPELFKKIADQSFKFAEEIWFSCGYEALMSKYFNQILEYSKKFSIPSSTLITNGMLLNDKNIESIMDYGLDRIVVSVDGAEETTFSRIRPGGSLKVLLANLSRLNYYKKKNDTNKPDVVFTVTLMKDNVREFTEIIKLASDYGVSTVWCKPLRKVVEGIEGQILSSDDRLLQNIFSKAKEIASVNKINLGSSLDMVNYVSDFELPNITFDDIEPEEESPAGKRFCLENPYPIMVVRPDGRAEPCSVWQSDAAGDFKYQDFEEIWNSEDFLQVRQGHENGNISYQCRQCPFRTWDNTDYDKGKDVNRALKDIYEQSVVLAAEASYDDIKNKILSVVEFEPLSEKSKAYIIISRIYSLIKDYDNAGKNIELALKYASDPEDLYYAYYNAAQNYKYSGHIPEALNNLEKALQIDSSSPDANAMMIELYLSAGDLQGAEKLQSSIKPEFRSNPLIMLSQAMILKNKGMIKKADETVVNAIQAAGVSRDMARMLFFRADCAFILGDFASSMEYVTESLSLEKDLIDSRLLKAKLHIRQKEYTDAQSELETVLKYEPDSIAAYRYMGLNAAAQNDYDRAKEYFYKALSYDGNNIELSYVNYNLGRLYLETKDAEQAEKHLSEALKMGCRKSDVYKDLGKIYSEKQEYSRACSFYSQALKRGHKSGDIHAELSIVFEHMGDLDKAISEMDQAISKGYKKAHSYRDLGRLLSLKGDYTEAVTKLQTALEIDSGDCKNNAVLGVIFEKMGDYENSRKELEKSVSGGCVSPEIHRSLAISLLNMNMAPAALNEFEKALAMNDKDHITYHEMSKAHEKLGNYEKALLYLENAAGCGMNKYIASREKGRLKCMSGNYSGALPDLKKALKRYDTDPMLMKDISTCYFRLQRYKMAERYIKKAIDLEPAESILFEELSRIKESLGDRSSAAACLEKALRKKDPSSNAIKDLARIYCDMGRYIKAENTILALIKKGDCEAENHLVYGRILEKKQNYIKALEQYWKALEKGIDNAEVHKGIAKSLSYTGDIKKAYAEIQKAVEISPDEPEPRLEYIRIRDIYEKT